MRFINRYMKLVTRRSQGLEVARAYALWPPTDETLHANFEYLYTSNNYPATHTWTSIKSLLQARKRGGAIVLTKMGKTFGNFIELDLREHLFVLLSCINTDDIVFLTSTFSKVDTF